jgi:crotonobetainyl-CoA:carnitine CoA-transferase CaiB-like acyl-CoA transferase
MDCDVSLFDTAIGMLTYPAIWALNGDFRPTRTHHSAHPSLVPFQAFEASDGWLVVACPKEKFWVRLAATAGRPELATDSRFANFAARRRNAGELLAILDEVFASRTVADWLDALRAAGVPCGPVNSVHDALADPQTADRGMVVETEHPRFGTVRQVRSPVRVGNDAPSYRRAPARHEDAGHVLGELLGYDARRIDELSVGGAFGPAAQ